MLALFFRMISPTKREANPFRTQPNKVYLLIAYRYRNTNSQNIALPPFVTEPFDDVYGNCMWTLFFCLHF